MDLETINILKVFNKHGKHKIEKLRVKKGEKDG